MNVIPTDTGLYLKEPKFKFKTVVACNCMKTNTIHKNNNFQYLHVDSQNDQQTFENPATYS